MRAHQKSLINLIRAVLKEPTKGAEIGVYKGETSGMLCSEFPTLHLLLVDTWAPVEEYGTDPRFGTHDQKLWDEIYVDCLENTYPHRDRITILQMRSSRAARNVPDNELDFVFLDANHLYEHVKNDIGYWTPKVRKGGLIMGHDYGSRLDIRGVWGVKKAVDEAFGEENIATLRGHVWATVKS